MVIDKHSGRTTPNYAAINSFCLGVPCPLATGGLYNGWHLVEIDRTSPFVMPLAAMSDCTLDFRSFHLQRQGGSSFQEEFMVVGTLVDTIGYAFEIVEI